MRQENDQLNQLLAELTLKNRVLKKGYRSGGGNVGRLIRRTTEKKLEVIHLVKHLNLPVKHSPEETAVPCALPIAYTAKITKTARMALRRYKNLIPAGG